MKRIVTFIMLMSVVFFGSATIEARTTRKSHKSSHSSSSKKRLYKIVGNRVITTGPTRIVLEFYTDWCKYCPPYARVLDNVQRRLPQITVVRINAEEHPEMARYYNITGYPETLLLDVNGYPDRCDRIRGYVDENYLYNYLYIRV